VSRRLVHALDLVADAGLIAAYEARHAPGAVWPEVVGDIRQRGYRSMEIWRIEDRLVMIAEVEDDFPRPADPALQPRVEAWEREMDAFQKPIRDDGPKWAPMARIFALDEQEHDA
jgi:L-rhamnose mutarotase